MSKKSFASFILGNKTTLLLVIYYLAAKSRIINWKWCGMLGLDILPSLFRMTVFTANQLRQISLKGVPC